jgi:hypothetical protein
MVRMAQRHGQRVCGVVRLRCGVQAQQRFHHVLNLGLFRTPVAGDRSLDFGGVYSITVRPPCTAASTATPRAWPRVRALRTFLA